MKVSVTAHAIVIACDRLIAENEKYWANLREATIKNCLEPKPQEPDKIEITTGKWWWKKVTITEVPKPSRQPTQEEAEFEAERALRSINNSIPPWVLSLRALCKYKRPDTQIDFDLPEIQEIAQYLTPYEDVRI